MIPNYTSKEYVFHYLAFGLYLLGGIWVLIDSLSDGRTGVIITGSVYNLVLDFGFQLIEYNFICKLFALLCSVSHLFHGIYSYEKSLDV